MELDPPPLKVVKLNEFEPHPPPPPPLYIHLNPIQELPYNEDGAPKLFFMRCNEKLVGCHFEHPLVANRLIPMNHEYEYIHIIPPFAQGELTPTFLGLICLVLKVPDDKRIMGWFFENNEEVKKDSYFPILVKREDGKYMLGVKYLDYIYLVEPTVQMMNKNHDGGNIEVGTYRDHNVFIVKKYNRKTTVFMKVNEDTAVLCLRNERGSNKYYLPYQF